MSARHPRRAEPLSDLAADQFVVSFGTCGALGVFSADDLLTLRRGQRVLVQTNRGTEIGAVLCPASILQARLLGAISLGTLLRTLTPADETLRETIQCTAQRLFEAGRSVARRDGLDLEILDVEVLFDQCTAIVQFVGKEADAEKLIAAIEPRFAMRLRLENLATPKAADEHARCDKPDCGRTAEGGGCSTCNTGGCSSCGAGTTDLLEYFGHLRSKIDEDNRIRLA